MPKPVERAKMSSILPSGLSRRLGRFLEKRLSLRRIDQLYRFWIQTRLLFSRALLVMLVALFAFFSYITLAELTHKQEEILLLLFLQCGVLTILLHMNLWETEREGRTFESLIMRVSDVDGLIWFKLRVSLVWTSLLTLPFFLGLSWFADIPAGRAVVYLFFVLTSSGCVALLTCVISSFVHRGLPSGILTAIVIWIVAGITEEWDGLWYRDYYRPYLNPFEKSFDALTLYEHTKILIGNRISAVVVAYFLYVWFRNRLRKTEKWVL